MIPPERIALIRERLDAHPKNYGLLLRASADKFRFCCAIADVRELLDFYEARLHDYPPDTKRLDNVQNTTA